MATLGERIKEYRKQLGVTQTEFAELCAKVDKREDEKWRQSRIGNYETDARTPSLDDLVILAKVLKVEPQALAFDENVVRVNVSKSYAYPLISAIQAGEWTDICDYAHSDGYNLIYTDVEASENAFFLEIKGQSMEPKFSEGDLVLIDPKVQPHPGSFVAAVNGDGEATFKQYKLLDGVSESGNQHFELIPLNPLFPTLSTLTRQIRIIGVAVEHRSYL